MPMIPTNRPVLSKDLETVTQQFGMLVSDACWVFGLSITKWTQLVRNNPEEPLKDPTLALLVRFLSENTDLSILPKFPSAEEMFELVNSVHPVDQKRFSLLFGSEASATYRWLKQGARMSPAVGRLMYYMRMALLSQSVEKQTKMMAAWRKTVATEGVARGVEDVFKEGAWKPKAKRPPRARAAAKKSDSE